VGVQQAIKTRHPEFREVYVHRVLPNRIEVLLKRRTPVAQASFSRFVQMDRDMVLLPGSSPAPFKNLTVIEGSPIPREGLAVGATLNDPATKRAYLLMDEIKKANLLRNHFLSKISIADPNNILLFVDQTIEIRIGNDHLRERLKILDQTLKSVELDSSKIRYIDLRFDDVVIGPR
jgi:cell division septal protein FtsQ